jgi:hypothetical protein
LRERGWLTVDDQFTDEGRRRRQQIEDLTDDNALAPWEHLGAEGCDTLRQLVRPLSQAVVAAGTFALTP